MMLATLSLICAKEADAEAGVAPAAIIKSLRCAVTCFRPAVVNFLVIFVVNFIVVVVICHFEL